MKFYAYILVPCCLFICIMWIWVPELILWDLAASKRVEQFVLYKNISLCRNIWVFMFICRYICNGYWMVLIDWLTLELDRARGIKIRTNLLKLGRSGNNHRLTTSHSWCLSHGSQTNRSPHCTWICVLRPTGIMVLVSCSQVSKYVVRVLHSLK